MKKGKFVKELERMMVSSMVVKLSSIKKMMIAMKSGQRALRWL